MNQLKHTITAQNNRQPNPKCNLIKQTQELQIRAIIKHTIPGNTGNAAQLMRLCSEWMNGLLIWTWSTGDAVIKQTHTVFYRTLTPDTRKLFTLYSLPLHHLPLPLWLLMTLPAIWYDGINQQPVPYNQPPPFHLTPQRTRSPKFSVLDILCPIPSHVLKEISPTLLPALTHLISTYSTNANIPTTFKLARVSTAQATFTFIQINFSLPIFSLCFSLWHTPSPAKTAFLKTLSQVDKLENAAFTL